MNNNKQYINEEKLSSKRAIADTEKIHFEEIFNAIPGNHLLLRPNPPAFTLLAVSDNYNTATYTSRKDIIGRSLFEVFPDNPHDNKANGMQNLFDSLMTVLSSKKEHRMNVQKYDVRRPDKKEFEEKYWSPVNSPVLDKKGNIKYIIHTVVDVTQLVKLQHLERTAREQAKISKETLFSVFAQVPAALAIFTGPDHIVQFANQRFLGIWNRQLDELINKPYCDVGAEMKGMPVEDSLREVYITNVPFHVNEYATITSEEGKIQKRYFNLVYQPFQNEDGRSKGVIVVANDITDVINSRNKAREAAQKLVDTNKELEHLAYSASHDLMEPLRKIQMFSDLIQNSDKASLSQKGLRNLVRITKAAERMSKLIGDLMIYFMNSREIEKIPTDLNGVVRHVAEELDLHHRPEVRLSYDNLPTIDVIPVQIHQLFINIIGNSIKFCRPNQLINCDIRCRKLPIGLFENDGLNPDVEYYEIQFSDNCIGFDQMYATEIFVPFRRLHHTKEYEGSGIGLATCKKIVTNHHGTIQARSVLGEGTTITVILPAHA